MMNVKCLAEITGVIQVSNGTSTYLSVSLLFLYVELFLDLTVVYHSFGGLIFE